MLIKTLMDRLRKLDQFLLDLIILEFHPSLFLKDIKRARYTAASDEDALSAYKTVTKFEKLRPSLEPSHAFLLL